jgi:hypothetical protein
MDKDVAAVDWEIGTARADSAPVVGLAVIIGAITSTAGHRRGYEDLGCGAATSAWCC